MNTKTTPATTPAAGELLPCPFCGGEAKKMDHRLVWSIKCVDCTCQVFGKRSPEPDEDMECDDAYWAAIEKTADEAWNRRAAPSLGRAPEPTKCDPIEANDDGWCDWQFPIHRGYKMACCDCGLVHDVEFDVERIVERNEDGSWRSETVEDADYRVALRMRREAAAEPTESTRLLSLLADIRAAAGDNGERMQGELVALIRDLARDAGRYRWLRERGGASWHLYDPGEDPKKVGGKRAIRYGYDIAVDADMERDKP